MQPTMPTIVSEALSLAKSHPHVPALDLLDLVMQGHHGDDLDFDAPGNQGFGDWTDPPSPFGELLRQAFAANEIGPGAAGIWASEDPDPAVVTAQDALVDHWQEAVVERFAQRYRLWG